MFFRKFPGFRSAPFVEEDMHRAANKIRPRAGFRMGRVLLCRLTLVIGVATMASMPFYGAPEDEARHWTGTWSAAPETIIGGGQYADQTLRLIVHTSIRGSRVRVRISNTFGTDPLVIGAAHLALRDAGARIVPGTDRVLSFSGSNRFAVPAGALVLSDPVYLEVPALTDLVVSFYLPLPSMISTTHIVANQTNYIAKSNGDFTDALDLPGASTTGEWDFLTGVEVSNESRTHAVVIQSDSVGDGVGSTSDANRRWSDFLARRLETRRGPNQTAVLNEAITGNRLLHSGPPGLEFFGSAALARIDRDVLAQSGVKYLIVSIGLADIGQAGVVAPASEEVSAGDLIEGYLQLINRAHEKGIAVYGCTLTPFENSLLGTGFYSLEKEAKREAVNEWIRTSGAFDAMVDFDKALRDPAHPLRILPAYDSGDHTHPNDAGHQALANAINLNLFRNEDSW